MLRQNGGYLNLTREWAKRLLSRMELGKHKATTTVKITAEVFEELKVQFVTEIEAVSMLEDIPIQRPDYQLGTHDSKICPSLTGLKRLKVPSE